MSPLPAAAPPPPSRRNVRSRLLPVLPLQAAAWLGLRLLAVRLPPGLQLCLQLALGTPDEAGAEGDGEDPVEGVGEELHRSGLVLPAEQRAHEHEEAVRLVVAALPCVPDPVVQPRPLLLGRPRAKAAQLLELVHGRGEEAGSDDRENHCGHAQEPLHAQLLRALEEEATAEPREHEGGDDGEGQGAQVVNVGDHAHEEDDGLQALAQASGERQHPRHPPWPRPRSAPRTPASSAHGPP
mmetsp:Transcript_59327/g.143209  ORF Transcript_59327/g.143209 Transcript_59327/m.143209 type:complete len:239 (-) Transcript_59327:803-1519(-)